MSLERVGRLGQSPPERTPRRPADPPPKPSDVQPHRLVFIADPQLIDPHSYPGRPWPLNPLTVLITDNYMRRSYDQLQRQLHPDTVFFLGDLFDGGREWKTVHGEFKDPAWSRRPKKEQSYAKQWIKKYGERFWLKEYARFGDIFIDPWNVAGSEPGPGQRGRKLIASLPGNHDLGFGSEVKLSVRDRFECYFGDTNRVDVIGNHTFVSVDTVSLSADSSDRAGQHEVQAIFKPVQEFLHNVHKTKEKAVARELRHQKGGAEQARFSHRVEELDRANYDDMPKPGGETGQADLPTILLSHVPLWRPPGTPCGPLREHWPPSKRPKGETEPVFVDDRNAISVSGGYQYQNVLSEGDSVSLIKKIGNVVHAFSGDDHDYCEVTHDEKQGGVREITVKSFSMAMGVPTPGFMMLSMYNPVDGLGRSLANAPAKTIQTHLCLLPNQLATFSRYALLALVTIALLVLRAFLVPVFKLQPFALEAGASVLLPVFKAKVDDYDETGQNSGSGASGFAARGVPHSRDRSQSGAGFFAPKPKVPGGGRHHHQASKTADRWGWGANEDRGPKIQIRNDDDFYDGGKWKAAPRRGLGRAGLGSSSAAGVVGREVWTSVWRVVWMVGLLWAWLQYRG